MATTKELSVSIQFADASKRALKFSGVNADSVSSLKARLRFIKAGAGGDSTISGWKELLRSSGGASATDIVAATYTVTDSATVYDSSTYSE